MIHIFNTTITMLWLNFIPSKVLNPLLHLISESFNILNALYKNKFNKILVFTLSLVLKIVSFAIKKYGSFFSVESWIICRVMTATAYCANCLFTFKNSEISANKMVKRNNDFYLKWLFCYFQVFLRNELVHPF